MVEVKYIASLSNSLLCWVVQWSSTASCFSDSCTLHKAHVTALTTELNEVIITHVTARPNSLSWGEIKRNQLRNVYRRFRWRECPRVITLLYIAR